jgi:uncharacterized membrane protein
MDVRLVYMDVVCLTVTPVVMGYGLWVMGYGCGYSVGGPTIKLARLLLLQPWILIVDRSARFWLHLDLPLHQASCRPSLAFPVSLS